MPGEKAVGGVTQRRRGAQAEADAESLSPGFISTGWVWALPGGTLLHFGSPVSCRNMTQSRWKWREVPRITGLRLFPAQKGSQSGSCHYARTGDSSGEQDGTVQS